VHQPYGSAGEDGALRIASVNLQYGGVDAGGSRDRWHALTGFLREQEPDVLLCQEMQAATPSGVERHLLDTARSLGMTRAALGPPAPGAASGSEHHTAVLVRPWLEVTETGPATAYRPWDHVPWAEALLRVPGLPFPLRVYSVHLPHSSDIWQKHYANKLASRIAARAEDGEQALAAGDWNCLAPGDAYTQDQLAAMPARVRPARLRLLPDGTWEPVLDVHQVLAAIGLTDIAASLPPDRRDPPALAPTGTAGGRVDRAYAPPVLASAVTACRQVRTPATDHAVLLLTISITKAAAIPGAPA
jgi:endonuclease/exonuclease/phosphatase family metal-dependent hydrolase